jgi:hypothetical protein
MRIEKQGARFMSVCTFGEKEAGGETLMLNPNMSAPAAPVLPTTERDILLIDDWFIWVWCPAIRRIREYMTECWPEWLQVDPEGLGSNVTDVSGMIPYLGNHRGELMDYTFDSREDALDYLKA